VGREIRRFAAFAVAGIAVLIGLAVLGSALTWWLPLGLVVFGVIATIPTLARGFLSLLCAAVVAMLALVAFNVALGVAIDWAPDDWVATTYRLPIGVGLVLAVLVFAWAAYYYLRATWLHPDRASGANNPRAAEDRKTRVLAPSWERRAAGGGSVLLACAVILGLPPLAAWIKERNEPRSAPLPAAQRLEPRLDVVIIADGVRPDTPGGGDGIPPVGLSVHFSVGQGRGRGVLWTRTGIDDPVEARAALGRQGRERTDPPTLRERANAVIVLLVTPTSNCARELGRWEEIADEARADVGAAIPVVALLSTSDPDAAACWRRSKNLAVVEELGTRGITDAAVAVATAAGSSQQQYFDVAFAYRPIVLFDDQEPVPRPLSIERMFEAGRIRQCPDLGNAGTCETDPVLRPEDLLSPGMHLVLEKPETNLRKRARDELAAWRRGESSLGPEPGDVLGYGSRIYVNPVPVTADGRRRLYLDYWWYLPDNPAGSGKRAFCGAGLVILGVTCFDHESDWEGVTVVLKRSGDAWEPLAVQYAQHASVVRYDHGELRRYWDSDSRLTQQLGRLPSGADRPVVFVASGTHASYADRCRDACRQVATDLEEGDHAGAILWVGADDEVCLAVRCLELLPTTTGGRGPASWNAFAGPWGRRHCLLKYYCDSGTPPAAPGQQERYEHPTRFDGSDDVTRPRGGYVPRPE
jgi:hypothetical protein